MSIVCQDRLWTNHYVHTKIDHKKKRLCLCLCLCSDATEGGTREIGLIEYPPAVKANRVESRYPVQTTDIMATMLDILGLESFEGRPLDGKPARTYLLLPTAYCSSEQTHALVIFIPRIRILYLGMAGWIVVAPFLRASFKPTHKLKRCFAAGACRYVSAPDPEG